MDVNMDSPPHGYTVDNDGNRWFWKINDENDLEFREQPGYPVEHPYKDTGEVPDEVRDETEKWIDNNYF
jgi:hypothetical protein